jgi:hypothetical protein
VSRGAQQADQLGRALGMVGQTAETVGQFAAQETAETKRENEKIRNRLRGQARIDAISKLPQTKQKIANGEIAVPEGKEINDHVRDLVEEDIEGAPEPYAEQFREIAVPELANAFAQEQAELKKQAREEDFQLLRESAQAAESTEQINSTLQEARRDYPDLTETEILDKIVVPKMRTAASTGNEEEFEVAAKALDGRFPGTVKQLRSELKVNVEREQADAEAERFNEAENMVAGALDQEDPNYDHLNERVDKLELSEVQSQTLKQRIETHRRQSIQRQRDRTVNRVQAKVQAGQWRPGRALQIAQEGANIFAQDPDNPAALTPNQVRQIQNVAGQTEQSDQRQRQISSIVSEVGRPRQAAAGGPGAGNAARAEAQQPRAVLNSGEDGEFEAALIEQGVLQGQVKGPGDATVTGLDDPTMAAVQFSRFATIPNNAKDLMARGFNVGQDQQLTEQATEAFVALWNINRPLAERFKKSLSDRGRLRAEFALTEMMRSSPPRVNENGEVSDAWLQRRQEVAQRAAQLEPPRAGRRRSINSGPTSPARAIHCLRRSGPRFKSSSTSACRTR